MNITKHSTQVAVTILWRLFTIESEFSKYTVALPIYERSFLPWNVLAILPLLESWCCILCMNNSLAKSMKHFFKIKHSIHSDISLHLPVFPGLTWNPVFFWIPASAGMTYSYPIHDAVYIIIRHSLSLIWYKNSYKSKTWSTGYLPSQPDKNIKGIFILVRLLFRRVQTFERYPLIKNYKKSFETCLFSSNVICIVFYKSNGMIRY